MAGCQLPDRHQGRAQTEAAGRRRAQGIGLPSSRHPGFGRWALGFGTALLLWALVRSASAEQAALPPVDQLVRTLQDRYDKVRDFSASFAQTYSGGVLRTDASERGTVLVKKPGKMRWTYTDPEEKLFVSDGVKLYAYFPADKQVTVTDVPSDDQASTPALFLAGRGNLTKDFTAVYEDLPDLPAGLVAVRFTPRSPEPEYEWLTLVVDRMTLEMRRLITVDYQGGVSTFAFSNLKENQGLSDTLFAFRPPRGTEVITSDTTLR